MSTVATKKIIYAPGRQSKKKKRKGAMPITARVHCEICWGSYDSTYLAEHKRRLHPPKKVKKIRPKAEQTLREKISEIDHRSMHYNADYSMYDMTTPNTPTYRRK
jgi:hypothetical protein